MTLDPDTGPCNVEGCSNPRILYSRSCRGHSATSERFRTGGIVPGASKPPAPPLPGEVLVPATAPGSDAGPLTGYDRVVELQRTAAAEVREILARPDAQHRDLRSCDDFDPWDILPSLYGSYDSRFDDCVIDVLCELRDRTRRRDDLAADMIREMLCSADLCDYGTSPRHCFATAEFRELLPELIERWRAYAKQQWEDD